MNDRLCNALPTILMVFVQFGFAGVNICYKLAANSGMSLTIIIAYRLLFASAFIVPIAFFHERGRRPKLTWSVLFYAFLSGLFGDLPSLRSRSIYGAVVAVGRQINYISDFGLVIPCRGSLTQNLYVQSLALTSATFASAIGNLSPAITFILAVSFRLERVNIRTMGGKAKVVGTLIGVGGAMLLTFYKGVELKLWSTHVDLLHESDHSGEHVAAPDHSINNQLLGGLLGVGSCLTFALWLIVQAKMSEYYPCHYSSTALMSIMGSFQAVGFALCVERRWSEWKLGWNIRLLSVAYTGVVASGAMVTLISWCLRMRGPLFVSVFTPLVMVLVAIAGSLFLEEKLYLGCLLGGVLIICGLYIVLWGKSQEMKKITQLAPTESIEHQHGRIDLVISPPTPLPKIGSAVRDSSNSNYNTN